jgi:hypothetical protein
MMEAEWNELLNRIYPEGGAPPFHYILDSHYQAKPVGYGDYQRWRLAGNGLWHVGLTTFATGEYVSTVFLGTDLGFFGEPQIFESMVFCQSLYWNHWQERYATYTEAMFGHQSLVRQTKRALKTQIATQVFNRATNKYGG